MLTLKNITRQQRQNKYKHRKMVSSESSTSHDLGSLLILWLLSLVIVLYVLGLCIYRLTLHPYAKYPGPFLAKVSSLREEHLNRKHVNRMLKLTYLYGTYHAYKGDMHLDVWKCHQKYGSYIIGVTALVKLMVSRALCSLCSRSTGDQHQPCHQR